MARRVLLMWCAMVLASGLGCDRPDQASLEEVVLDRTEGYACELVFEPTGVILRSDETGSVPDPGRAISQGPDGRLFTSTPRGGMVIVWSQEGEFLHTIGQPGEGPGEFAAGSQEVFPLVQAGERLHVFDPSALRWSRFDLDGEFISSASSPHFQNLFPAVTALVGEDSVLISVPGQASEPQFRVVDGEGVVRHGFATRPVELPELRHRVITYRSGQSFWAAPPVGSSEYVLEEWSLHGELLRRIHREAPWFPGEDADALYTPFPILEVYILEGGRLMVSVTSPSVGEEPGGPLNVWYEVIDPERQDVVASRQLRLEDPRADWTPRFDVAPGTNLGVRGHAAELGLPVIELVTYALVPGADPRGEDQC